MSDQPTRTGRQIRQDFISFFEDRKHTIVPSASLMPDAPNLLFTNAGMNQFVPVFLGEQNSPYNPGRAAERGDVSLIGDGHGAADDPVSYGVVLSAVE